MKKALLVTTVSGFVPQFEMNNVKILQEMGYEVHYAANYDMPSYGKDNSRLNGTGIIGHQVDFVRSPYSRQNLRVYRQLKTLMQQEHFDLVHCHTPMGGVMARLAAHAAGVRPVIYTAHGFHFFKGAPLINWLVYYPVERWLSRWTDQQICINQEDYERAKRFYARRVDYVPGVGMDLKKLRILSEKERLEKREELGIEPQRQVLLSVGELIRRKNHESVIRAIAKLKDPSLLYLICGHGELEDDLKSLVNELGLTSQVWFAGYRTDVIDIYQISNLYIFPSYQEGLPMALLEAMSCGMPVICSDIRGSSDLMNGIHKDGWDRQRRTDRKAWKLCDGGIMVTRADDTDAYTESIRYCMTHLQWLQDCGKRNTEEAKQFSLDKVDAKMREIYQRYTPLHSSSSNAILEQTNKRKRMYNE